MPYLNCLNCNKQFYARPSMIKRGFGRYCSKTCSNQHSNPALAKRVPQEIEDAIIQAYLSGMSKREAAALYNYGRGATDKILKRRGIKPRTPSEALSGRVFSDEWKAKISRNHANISGTNNPMFGQSPTNPKGKGSATFVPHLGRHVRSSWEATVANVLHTLNIAHEYEKHRIDLGDCSTLIDFYLPTYDTYIEVKGLVNKHFAHVLKRLKEVRPDINLIVIYQEQYLRLVKDPEYLLELLKTP